MGDISLAPPVVRNRLAPSLVVLEILMKAQREAAPAARRVIKGLLLLSAVLPVSVLEAQEWTRFRGPNGQGISDAKTIPVKWTENDYNWKVELPGGGHSSPVLWGDTIFVTSGDQKAGRGILLALIAPTARSCGKRNTCWPHIA